MAKKSTQPRKLTRTQPSTLFAIVRFANQNGGYCPTSKELAPILKTGERNASRKIKLILIKQPDCFIQEGRTSRLNYNKLCTEPETAHFLLLINKNYDQNGKILREKVISLRKELSIKFNQKYENDDQCIDLICEAGYLDKLPMDNQYLRQCPKFKEQFEYLKLLAEWKVQL